MHVVVVANGDLPAQTDRKRLLERVQSADLLIAADGGLAHCADLERWPDVLVGDLDSAPPALVEQARSSGVRIVEYPADKDATDLELALAQAVTAGATEITVVAAFGGRLDHELATIGLLAAERWGEVNISAVDGRRCLWVIRRSCVLSLAPGDTLSLVPWAGDVTGVTTAGLQWPLHQATLPMSSTLGVSNIAVEAVQVVSVHSGTLLAVADSLAP